jgi:UV DNA damage endonuclease
MKYFPQIKQTWTRKGITQKQHYSEPCPGAVTGREMRKHSPRVAVLPPCDDTMDLMIEAKDKEQAVFELYRKYNIGPKDHFEQVIPHERTDDNRAHLKKQKSTKKRSREELDALDAVALIPQEEIGMGGSQRRVYWPQGHEHWLSPPKRPVKRKENIEEEEETEVVVKKRRKRATKPAPFEAADQNEAPMKGMGKEAVGVAPAVDASPKNKRVRKRIAKVDAGKTTPLKAQRMTEPTTSP